MTKSLSALLILIILPSLAHAGVRRVWVVNDGEKVEQDALNHPASARNSAWDGHVVHIFGARNEIVAFQVIVETDAKGVDAAVRPADRALLSSRPDRLSRTGVGSN